MFNDINGYLSEKYDEIKMELDEMVQSIRLNVSKSNPEHLMNFLVSMNYLIMLDKPTEASFEAYENYQLRSVEYVQSILASTESIYDNNASEEEQEKLYFEILSQTTELYKKIPVFLLCWAEKNHNEGLIPNEDQDFMVYSQLMSQVRGNQYQCFRLPVLKSLLEPHSCEIEMAYGLSFDNLVNGLEQLEENLSSGKLEAIKKMTYYMEKITDDGIINQTQSFKDEVQRNVLQVIGLDLYDIKKATDWPDELINDLTYDIGENKTFFSENEFCGWPIWNLPVHGKPCIRINGVSYVFDYYVFFDYFYRVFQKAIVKRITAGETIWKDIQTEASERLVSEIFENLLPDCIVHRNNYYPYKKNNSAENDILIEYRDTLFIIEVKAGAFTYTPALLDYQAHRKSIKDLVEKAEAQCLRTKDYILRSQEAVFYDNDNLSNETFRLKKENYSQIYMFDVTVDDFNEIASQMEKIQVSNTHEDIIVISLDDLWVYKNYFNNPLLFIHFIKQRQIATRTKEITTFDELDHLGLYIQHNLYYIQAEELGKMYSAIYFDGYREDIDQYFSLKHQGIEMEKPAQFIPNDIMRIIEICEDKEQYSTQFTNFLLDMSSETKEEFCRNIHYLSRRGFELNTMIPAIVFGDISYCLYVKNPLISNINWEEEQEYVLAVLAKNGNEYCYLIEVELDSDENIIAVKDDFLTQYNIPIEEKERLIELGDFYAKRRTKS